MPDRLPEVDDEIRTLLGGGQAALWLGESLILALVEANLLNTETILEEALSRHGPPEIWAVEAFEPALDESSRARRPGLCRLDRAKPRPAGRAN
jgi:hypothetical protein